MTNQKNIYLDYQASTPVSNEVLEVMQPFFSNCFANPHSNEHSKGWEVNRAIEKSRKNIALALNIDKDELIFTSGATESNNLVLKGLLRYFEEKERKTIIVSSIEHKCILESAAFMKQLGFEIIYLRPNSEGIVTAKELKSIINSNVGLVSVMLVNNEIGTIQPVKKLAEIAHEYGALFHTDAAQAEVFMKLNVEDLFVDFLSISGHKAYGPKGIGALYISREYKNILDPLIHGGGQEDGLRSGSLPTPLVVGLGKALEICELNADKNYSKLEFLSDYFWNELKNNINGLVLNGSRTLRHPGNLNIRFPNINSSHFLQCLQPHISASTGSACNSGNEMPSYVLTEIGLKNNELNSSIRFSFGIDQNIEDIKYAVRIICEIYNEQLLEHI